MGPCGAARIGHGDSVLNDPDSRRLSVTVACEWSHARCEWSLTQRPRVGRSLGPGAGDCAQRGPHSKPPSRAPTPRAGDLGDFQFPERRDALWTDPTRTHGRPMIRYRCNGGG